VEHTFVAVESSARPWRTATLVAAAVAALELVLIVVLLVAVLGRPVADRVQQAAERKVLAPAPKPKPEPVPVREGETVAAPKLTRRETSVLVLNGNGLRGAAATAAATVHGKGYVVGGVGNAERTDFARSVVMYRKGFEPEAKRLARDLGVKVVGPLDGLRAGDLMGAHLAYVVGDRA
jgi:LytR cell envelope-related transcriptional attenuator